MLRRLCIVGISLAVVAGCDSSSEPPRAAPTTPVPVPTTATSTTTPSATSPTSPSSSAAPSSFRPTAARRTVEFLAGEIGPREATSASYKRAATWVEQQLASLGYTTERQGLRVPSGVSWGVPVRAGRSWNVIARPSTLRDGEPYLLAGAQLDTVPQAPGAEDNASGVAVLLELARLAAAGGTRLPVVFVAFTAEEPRGPGDDQHHFGSRAMVRRMSGDERAALRGMVSIDRVGVGRVVPICTGGRGTRVVHRQLLQAARQLDIAVRSCHDNRSSDHWPFEKAGLPAARVGSTPYAQYHSPADRPGVVSPAQMRRAGRVTWQWMSG